MKRRRPALKVEADYRILVDPYIPPLPPGPAARWRRWLIITGILLLLVALGAGVWWVVQRPGKQAPAPDAPPVAAAASNETVEAATEPEIPELPIGVVDVPGAGEEPEARACYGGMVIQAQAPASARAYFQNTAKRFRLETNAWTSIPALPHILTNQPCGMAEVGFEATGFRSDPPSRRILVQEGRTNDAGFTLHPLPAALTITCNVTNAVIALHPEPRTLNPDTFAVPSLQPVSVTVMAPGQRTQTLTLGPFDPLTTNRHAVTLEREVGALRIEAEVPTNAPAFFQGVEKKIRIAANDWKTVSLPHVEEGLACVETPVELTVIGFGTANERELTRIKVEDGRTNTVVFRLQPLPATLTINCNVTDAVVRIADREAHIPDSIAIPSLQPLSLTVSSAGYVEQLVKLDPVEPGKIHRLEVILNPPLPVAEIPSSALGDEWPTKAVPLTADHYWAWARRRDTGQGYRQFCSHYPNDPRSAVARARWAKMDFARAWWDNSRSAYLYVEMEHAEEASELAALAGSMARDPALRRVPYPSDQERKRPLYQACQQTLLAELENDQYNQTDEILGEIRDPSVVKDLHRHLPDKTLGTSIGVARALGVIGDPAAVDALVGVAGRQDLEVLRALGTAGDPRAVEVLIKSVRPGEYMHHRSYAAESLGRICDARAVPALKNLLLADADRSGREEALTALLRIGGPGVAAAREAVQSERVIPSSYCHFDYITTKALNDVVPQAEGNIPLLRLLVLTGDPRSAVVVTRRLEKAVSSKDKDAVEQYQFALDRLEDPVVVETLVKLLSTDWVSPYARTDVIRSLGRTGDSRAVDALLTELEGDARVNAVEALGAIGHSRAIPALRKVLEAPQPERPNSTMLCAVIQALALIGDPSILPVIQPFLNDQNDKVRFAAAFAAGRLGGESAVADLEGVRSLTEIGRATALGETESLLAVLPVLDSYKDGYWGEHLKVLTSLAYQYGPESVLKAAEGKPYKPEVKRIVAQAVAEGAKLRYEAMLLSRMLGDPVFPADKAASPPQVHAMIAVDLANWLPRNVPAFLTEELKDTDPVIRVLTAKHILFLLRAQELLGEDGTPRADG